MLSYWEQTTFLQKADLIIVGSGIVGLSAAISWKDQHPQHLVVVLERGVLPWGASTRNAGFACFGSLTELIADLDHHTEEEVISLLEQRYRGLQKLRQLIGDRAMEYQELGGYELFRAEEETIYETCLAQMGRFNQIIKDIGIHSEVFQKADQRMDVFGFRQVQHLIWNVAEGQIHTGKMMQALLQLARSKGVAIYNGLEVTEMEDGGEGVILRSANGWLWKADTVLVANNGFASRLLPDLQVVPARNQVLITEPVPGLTVKGTFHYQQGYFYFRNIDNRILLGGGRHLDPEGEQTDEFGQTPQIQEALLHLLREVILPDVTPAIAQRWSGILGIGGQKQPIIQLYSENIGVAVRLGGMGVAIGTEIGSRAAQMMAARGRFVKKLLLLRNKRTEAGFRSLGFANSYMCMNRIVSILLFTFLSITLAFGQEPNTNVQDTSRKEQVIVDHADLFEYIQLEDSVMQRLIGNVELRQDSVNFYCDSAFIINEVDVIAMGNVVIQQGDSLTVFADSLAYEGEKRIADLFGEVILASGNQRLFTDRLNYDLNQKLATYESGAVLTNDTTQLTSKRGYYYVDLDEIYFKDSVQIIDPNFELKSDTLKYHTTDKVATFLAPTLIIQNESKIYCEGGFYDIGNETAVFKQNPQYLKNETKATADTIRYFGKERQVVLEGNALFLEGEKRAEADLLRYFEVTEVTVLQGNALYKDEDQFITSDTITYDQKNDIYATRGRSLVSDPPQLIEADQLDYDRKQGQGLAIGNVIWRDTSSELTIICEIANYDEQTDYLKASGGRADKPLLITKVEGDSLFLTSDTLIAFRPDSLQNDSSRILLAFNDVRIYKNNLQALCDSLVYSSVDSMFRLYQSPMIWSDTSQFSADTIHMQLAEGKIDRILLFNKSFIINTPDEQFFNQVKGKYVTAFFESEEIRRMEVKGNAESVYYAIDEENAYIGANQTVCSEMMLFFGNNQVEEIRFYTQPKGTFTPMREATGSKFRLTGFKWDFEKAPQSLDDLFLTDKQ